MNNVTLVLVKSSKADNDPRLIKEIRSIKKLKHANLNILSWNRNNEETDTHIEINGTRRELNLRAPISGFMIIFFWPVWWLYILFWLLRMNWDIVHAVNYDSVFPALIAAKLKRKPVIYEILDTTYDVYALPKVIRSFFLFTDKVFMRFSDAIILVDENQIKQFGVIPNSNIYIIYDSALDVFNKRLVNEKDGNFIILYVGVLYKKRRLNLDKLCYVVQNLQGVQLLIAGYGDLVEDIKKWADESKGKIKFIGRINYLEALKLSLDADALVVLRDPSVRINKFICGSKIWEAMMCGKPILVNKGTSTAEKVLKENCGLVVDANNVEKIKAAIIKLRDNPKLCKKLGTNARKAYEQKYGWEIMERRLIALYTRLTHSG